MPSQPPAVLGPVLIHPVTLNADYSPFKKAHISNSSTSILHLYLTGLENKSLPPDQVELVLKKYLDHHLLKTIEQVYDFRDGIDAHKDNVNKWVEAVWYVQSSPYNTIV